MFASYLRHATPKKGETRQMHDSRCAAMWERILGSGHDMTIMDSDLWDGFIEDRTSGAIDSSGRAVSERKRQPVRARTVCVDIDWLRAVIHWAKGWRKNGARLMTTDPTEGLSKPKMKGVRRPVVSQERYEAVRRVTDDVMMEQRWHGKRTEQRSYLSELVDLVFHTGRRIDTVCGLTYDDLRLTGTKAAPHGAIRWPWERDKEDEEFITPMNRRARAAIDRALDRSEAERLVTGKPIDPSSPLFPSPCDRNKPVDSKGPPCQWRLKAEKMANLKKQDGTLWHGYRRGWATARKELPAKDVAQAGGWKSPTVLELCYQQATDAGVLAVVMAKDGESG